jgi:hypothetical protein
LRVAEFAAWFKGGNPFAAERLPGSLDPTVNICEEEGDHQTLNTKGLGGTGTSDNWVVQVEGDKDDKKNEDLLLATDSIDEGSQLQGHPHTLWRSTTSTTVLGIKDHSQVSAADNEKSLIVTNSSVCIFRYMEKYARLMQIFQPIASEVFKGLCQLFDLYFFSIYKMFGQREAFSGSQGQSNSYCKFVDLNYFSPFFNLILEILLRVYEGKFPFCLKILCYLLSCWYYLSSVGTLE